MTTDADVQTVIYIPIKKPAEPKPHKVEKEPELEPAKAKEELHGRTYKHTAGT